jgi:hypothetical protein
VAEKLPADFTKFPHGFPTRENCDPTNPYQAYLWALVAMPYQKGAQLVLPVDYLQFVSKRLWDCFGPPNPDWEPTIKYQPPLNTDPNWLTSPGKWVDASEPDRDPRRPVEKAVDNLVSQQQAELARELWRRMTPEQRRMLSEGDR